MGPRPPVAADSEVYKMLQENQESDEPPRQSASFRVLQEILETGTNPGFLGFRKASWISIVTGLCWNKFSCASPWCICRRLWQAVGFPKCESSLDKGWIICGEHAEAARVRQVWLWDCVSFYRWHLSVFCMAEVVQSLSCLYLSPALVKTSVNSSTCGSQQWLLISRGSL